MIDGTTRLRSIFVAAFAAALLATTAAAQDAQPQSQYAPIAPVPLGDTLLTLPTSHIPYEGTWEIKFTHRFNQSIDQGSGSDRVHSLFGLDSNADVAIGLSYAPTRDLQFSLSRSNALDDMEGAVKYVVIQQAPAIPISLAVRGGVDWRTERDVTDRSSLFAQFVLSRQFAGRAEVFIMPTFVTNAGRATTDQTSQALFDHAVNVPIGAALLLGRSLSLVAEFTPKNHDLPSSIAGDFGWAVGLKRAIGGHYFEILLTNSNGTTVDQYTTTTYQGAGLRRGDLHLGFNIERRFGVPHIAAP